MMYHQVELYLTTTKCYGSAVRSLRINKRNTQWYKEG